MAKPKKAEDTHAEFTEGAAASEPQQDTLDVVVGVAAADPDRFVKELVKQIGEAPQRATRCRIVEYADARGERHPAIVAAVLADDSLVLWVFPGDDRGETPNLRYERGVPYDAGGRPHSWSWPNRID